MKLENIIKTLVVLVLFVLGLNYYMHVPAFAQDVSYHDFADQRPFLGIPNFMDVLSNILFIVYGIMGMRFLKTADLKCEEKILWGSLFVGSILTGFGSGYYHLGPENHTLVWDRIPMTIAFMSLFSIIIYERMHAKAGLYLLPVFLIIGISSVFYWDYTESIGQGDLRFYMLVQLLPLAAIPIVLLSLKGPYTGTRYFIGALAWYVLAKVLDKLDKPVFELLSGIVSGHSLKHIAAALGLYVLIIYLRKRKPRAQAA